MAMEPDISGSRLAQDVQLKSSRFVRAMQTFTLDGFSA